MEPSRRPDPILGLIEEFLRAENIGPATFGRRALGDPKFVFDLREGRDLRWSTRSRIMAFIERATARAES
jgi:hypothetical protein